MEQNGKRTRRPGVANRRATGVDPERRLTATIVEQVIPALVDSLALACSGDSPWQPARCGTRSPRPRAISDRSRAGLLDESRRLTINLLTFLAAASQGQLPKTASRQGSRLLARLLSADAVRRGRRAPAVLSLRDFLLENGARAWGRLAPRHVANTDRSKPTRQLQRISASDARLTTALQTLFDFQPTGSAVDGVPPDIAAVPPGFTPRMLGAVHEALLGRQLEFDERGARLPADRASRRRSGSFYTPEPMVALLVDKTIGPVLRRRLPTWLGSGVDTSRPPAAKSRLGLTIIDPAMGSGHFLTAAMDYVATRVAHGLNHHATAAQSIKRQLLAHSIYGIDSDPDSVELARLSLWLASGLPPGHVAALAHNLVTDDALIRPFPFGSGPSAFDVVIGNPPYGTPADPDYRDKLRRSLPQTRHNSDLAAAFVERSLELVAGQGQIGLVLPKPLTYSFAWRHLRSSLYRRLRWICDVRCGWDDVLLEQALIVFAAAPAAGDRYRVGALARQRARALPPVPRPWSERFDVLLSALSRADFQRLETMRFADKSLGDVCRTFRGLPWQRRIAATGELPILGGRDLARWAARSSSGLVTPDPQEPRLAAFAQQKLLFQNIVAHIERPQPHVRLIGTLDPHSCLTLDTVNNLVARDGDLDLRAVLALLHSEPVNWLVYGVVYNRAIRTMHFDQYFLNKIPLPANWTAAAPQLAQLAERAIRITQELNSLPSAAAVGRRAGRLIAARDANQQAIDRLVAQAYGEK